MTTDHLAPRRRLAGPAIAVLAATVLAGAGTAAATGWLPAFQPADGPAGQPADDGLDRIADLLAAVEVEIVGDLDLRAVPGPDAVSAATGLDVPHVAVLPAAVTGPPRYSVTAPWRVIVTLPAPDERPGEATPPAGPDGARVEVGVGSGLVVTWPGTTGQAALAVARAGLPSVRSADRLLEQRVEHLLARPALLADLASRLPAALGEQAPRPLPGPDPSWRASRTAVDGAPGALLAAPDGTAAAVLWVEDGVLTAVAAPASGDEVLAIAAGVQ